MGQTGTAFGAAAFHNLPPGAGRHTLQEAVLFAPLAFFWLISLFRHNINLIKF